MAEPPDRTATLERAEAPTADGGHREDRRGLYPGALLCKYTLERVLGEGGMGIVWCARDPDLQRSVAIKLLQCDDASPDARQRLLREARAMARLKHPNVITVYEVDSDGDRDYIAMELVEGASMDAWLTAKPPAEDVWCAIVAAGRGLAAAHAAGLVHRDFKPHNVLRSRDGRVLVTDFGLARGTGEHLAKIASAVPNEPVALARTLEAPRTDAVLDSTLTEPGSLMGTPAYMAPEQFTGSDPDPRTDQFAFCITAWQALTGCRPFTGESLAELRASASAGVAKIHAKLPRAVRAVLVRGLAAGPEKRWPDMDALLDALERAHDRPKRRRALVIPALALVAAVALFVTIKHDTSQPMVASNRNGCAPPDKAFDAWTAGRRAAFDKRLDHQPTAVAIANAFDGFRTAWLARYTAACAAAPSSKTAARINCLLGERDDMDGLARLTDTVPTSAIAGVELWGLLPSLTACDGDSPVAPPLLPEDRKQRDAIIRVRAELAALRTDPQAMQDRYDSLVERAQKLGWKPLVAEVEVSAATSAQLLGATTTARDRFTTAAEAAVRLADYQVEATARIGLLEVELEEMADPRDRTHVERLIAEAKDAVERAGSDPALATTIDLLAGEALVSQGKLDDALAAYDRARAKLLAAQALRPAAVATEQELHVLRGRGEPADLERAWQTGLAMERAIAAAGRPVAHSGLGTEMAELAWLRGDLEEAHGRADRLEHEAGYDTTITGRVVDAAGKPVAGARVATGAALAGDATRIFTLSDPRATAVSAADGSFTVIGAAHGAILAELGDQRSPPLASTSGVTLRLGPTHTIHGTVHGDAAPWHPTGLVVFARYPTGWRERAVVATDGTFTLANLPAGAAEIGLASDHHDVTHEISGAAVRDGATLVWPSGPELDVIVRAPLADRIVIVKRGTADIASAHAEPIGLRTATPEGAASYATGDRHVVIDATTRGSTIAVCATKLPCTSVKIGVQPVAVVVH